jgi:hypothetical protein
VSHSMSLIVLKRSSENYRFMIQAIQITGKFRRTEFSFRAVARMIPVII